MKYTYKKERQNESAFPSIAVTTAVCRIIKKGQTAPVYSVSQTEPLNVFNYEFKVGKRNLIKHIF